MEHFQHEACKYNIDDVPPPLDEADKQARKTNFSAPCNVKNCIPKYLSKFYISFNSINLWIKSLTLRRTEFSAEKLKKGSFRMVFYTGEVEVGGIVSVTTTSSSPPLTLLARFLSYLAKNTIFVQFQDIIGKVACCS